MSLVLLKYRRTIFLSLVLMLTLLPGCTYTSAVSQTNIPAQRGKEVTANVYKFIVLGFNFDNDEVLQLTNQLKSKCPSGDVRGILTKDMRTYYFLVFFWARETNATGFCVPHKNLADQRGVMLPGDENPGAPAADLKTAYEKL